MSDPRLNSVHLDQSRRQEFRRVRKSLLEARGQQTIAAEEGFDEDDATSKTAIQSKAGPSRTLPELDFWLVDQECVYPLKVGLNTLGRAPENDVVVEDPSISRRHCAILVHVGKDCELHDTASKNGTFLNEHRLQGPTPLSAGDLIRICDRHFVFQSRNEAAKQEQVMPTLTQ